MKIKQNDIVEVISGKDRGKHGKVIEALPKENRLRVEGVQMIKKHVKPQRRGERGWTEERPGKIHVSNVMFVDQETGERTRVSYKVFDNKKVRYSHKLNKEL